MSLGEKGLSVKKENLSEFCIKSETIINSLSGYSEVKSVFCSLKIWKKYSKIKLFSDFLS